MININNPCVKESLYTISVKFAGVLNNNEIAPCVHAGCFLQSLQKHSLWAAERGCSQTSKNIAL